MAETIAELVVKLGVDADDDAVKSLDESMKGAGASAGGARRALGGFAKGVGAVAAVAAGAVVGLLKMADSTAVAADSIIKGARRAGIGGQEFQKLAFAAKEADVSEQALIKTSSQFAIMMRDAGKGDSAAEPFIEALGDIGLGIDDLEGKSRTEQFGVIADELNKVGDAGERTALSAEIFGKRYGPELANLLAQGSAGINDVSGSLKNVFTDEQFSAAEEYNDAITEMQDRFAHVKTEASAGLLPVMTDVADRVSAFIDENEDLISQDLPAFVAGLADIIETTANFTVGFVDDVQALNVEFGRLNENTDEASQVLVALRDTFIDIGDAATDAAKAIGLVSDTEEKVMKKRGLTGVDQVQTFARAGGAGKQATADVAAAVATTPDRSAADLKRIANDSNVPASVRANAAAFLPRAIVREERKKEAERDAASPGGRRKPRRARRGGGKSGKKEPTPAELIDAAAQGRSKVGGVEAPRPNVAIAITNVNTFDQVFNLAAGTTQETAQEISTIIQEQINKGNVEAARLTAPIVLR